MSITSSRLTRATGLSAMTSGLLYILIQPIHPEETVEAVSGTTWLVVGYLTIAMALTGLVGLTGIYLRQVTEGGLLGLLGYALFAPFYVLVVAFTFAETLVLPHLTEQAPGFVDSFNGLFSGEAGPLELGALATASSVAGVLYLGGGVLTGLAVRRAGVLDGRAGLLLAVGTAAALLVPLFPHGVARYAAVPVGLAMLWLGHSLYSLDRDTTGATDAGVIPSARRGRDRARSSADLA